MTQDKAAILYESVHRIEKLINELEKLAFKGHIGIYRELTKMFEQKLR
jgi:16S rRNA C1402 (ribose-2'-O) methylase RsmI